MEQPPQLLVYKASAGSGKTFTLAVQYIRQLMEDPFAYRKILAVTFTNKATAEMKERILSQLYGIAVADPGSSTYLEVLRAETGKSESEIRETAQMALKNIVHDYSRFRIETIDSFFQSVMRNLARELELGANLNINLDNDEALSEGVDRMIEKLDRNSPILTAIMDFIEERIAEDKKWNVSAEIKSFGKNIFNEEYIEKGSALRKKLANPQFIPAYKQKLKQMRTDALEEMKSFAGQFYDILEANGLEPDDLIRKKSGISNYFKKLAEENLKDDIRNKTVEDCLEDAEKWASKTSPRREEIVELAASRLMGLLHEAEQYRAKNNQIVNSCKLSLRHLNSLSLLTHIDREVRLQNQEHNRFQLSDTNALLHELIREGDASFVYEKIGTHIDTVMIDEFQDTSRMQWENFRLLLEESLAQKEGSLIVGDIKQSIYRWRNGDWRILANLDKDPTFRIKSCTLDTNWRSEANIIRFNNELFTAACRVLSAQYETEQGEPCTPLINAYDDVCQQTRKKDERGYVKLAFLPSTGELPYQESMLVTLAAEVDRLVKAGVKLNEIAILVRKKKVIPLIGDYFNLQTPYRVISDEAFYLSASPAIGMIIDGLRYLAQPEDTVTQARLAVDYQREVLKKDISLHVILQDGAENYLPAAFRMQEDELRLMPLYELMEELYGLFGLQAIPSQDAYLCAFYDAVTEYQKDHSSELTAFLTYWDEKLYQKTIPSGEIDGIRILSIHKSKGLEYHTVIVPYCDWKMESETNSHLMWCPADDTVNLAPFNELDLTPINYSEDMAQSFFRNSYLTERLQLWIDNLNILYVAFTRACKNLIVIGKDNGTSTSKKNGSSKLSNVSQLLLNALGTMDGLPSEASSKEAETNQPDGTAPEEEAPLTYEFGTLCPSEPAKAKTGTNRLTLPATAIPIHIEPLPRTIEFKQSNRSTDFIRGDEDEDSQTQYIQQGQLLHQLFASIEEEKDLPDAIRKLCMEGVLESEKQAEQIGKLAAWALSHPSVKAWYDGSWELFNECAILSKDEDGSLMTRRPDRVMMKDGQTVVVDFKFGKPKESYQKQVQEYIRLLAAMGYENIQGYLWYVFENKLVEVG